MRWTAIELAVVELDRIRGVRPGALWAGDETAHRSLLEQHHAASSRGVPLSFRSLRDWCV